MAIIKRTIKIAAKPEDVFDLISRVEDFPKYSRLITYVKKFRPNRYKWKAHINGLWFEWYSVFVHREKPKHISWRSISGLKSHGDYWLQPVEGGTKVIFKMEYHLPSHLMERVLKYILTPLIDRVFLEALFNIKRKLENDTNKVAT